MNTPDGTDGTKTSIRSLRELSHDIPPPRDLWPAIAAEIAKEETRPVDSPVRPRVRRGPSGMQWLALAATVAALAVGMWLGRTLFPAIVPQQQQLASNPPQDVVAAAYVRDPRYLRDRAQLVRTLEAKMKTLPPETQKKVLASLETIRTSITDIQAALGKDPGNALLQELLVNSYQEEMRVLTAVQEAGNAGREI